MTTKQLEDAIYRFLRKTGTYLCFEMMIPGTHLGCPPQERVDLISYNTKGLWKFYELKVSKKDFYSKAKHTFKGHFIYYVMPYELYEENKEDIPSGIGVYAAKLKHYSKIPSTYLCESVRNAKRQELGVDEERLMFSFMQALSREYDKYRISQMGY